MAMNAFESRTEQGFSSDDDNDVINLDSVFETELKSFEEGKLPEDIKLPEGFEVCEYPNSPSDRLVLTDGTMFVVGHLRIVSRKVDANLPAKIGILPVDDPRFSALIKKQLDKKARREAWIRRTGGGARLVTPRPDRDNALIARMHREGRKENAQDFRREGSSMDEKTFVWPGGAYRWSDESSGVTWIGVHGMNSICVVTKAGELDVTCVHPSFKYVTVEKALCKFRKTVISEIKDLASPSSTFIKMFDQSIPKPFGAVSLALGSDDAHEESDRMASATTYLERKMKMMVLEGFTVDETIKTAISGFQYLFKKELESHEIAVSVMDMDPGYAKHLERTDIQKYLAAIKEPASLEPRFRP